MRHIVSSDARQTHTGGALNGAKQPIVITQPAIRNDNTRKPGALTKGS